MLAHIILCKHSWVVWQILEKISLLISKLFNARFHFLDQRILRQLKTEKTEILKAAGIWSRKLNKTWEINVTNWGKIYFLQDLKDTNFDQKLLLPATISVKKMWSKWFLMFLMIMIPCVSEPSFACISPIEKASFTTVERWVSTLFTLYLLWVLHFPIFHYFIYKPERS